MQISALNASSSLLDPIDILRFVYANRSSTEPIREKREEREEHNTKKVVSAAPASSSSSSSLLLSSSLSLVVEEEAKDINDKTPKELNVENENQHTENKCTSLQKLLLVAAKSNRECICKEDNNSDITSTNEVTTKENVFRDNQHSKLNDEFNDMNDADAVHETEEGKQLNQMNGNEQNVAKQEGKANAQGQERVFATLIRDNYETRIALSNTAQQLAYNAVERALKHGSLPEERYHRALWQLLKCTHEQAYSHHHCNTTFNLNDNNSSAKRSEEYHGVNDYKKDNITNCSNEVPKLKTAGKSIYKSPFADIIPVTWNENKIVQQKVLNKPVNNNKVNDKEENTEHPNIADSNVNATVDDELKCSGKGENKLINGVTNNDIASKMTESNNDTNVDNKRAQIYGEKNMSSESEKVREATIQVTLESTAENISERLVQRYVQCCEVLHTRPLQCVKLVLCKSEKNMAHSTSSSESLQNNTSSSPFASIDEIEQIRNEHFNPEEVNIPLSSSAPDIQEKQGTTEAHESNIPCSPSSLATTVAATVATTTTTKATTTEQYNGDNSNNQKREQDNTVGTKSENKVESMNSEIYVDTEKRKRVSETAAVNENVINTLPSATAVTAVPSSPSRSHDTELKRHSTLSDTITSFTTSQQPSTLSLRQLISLNFARCKNLSDARAFVAVLGVLETIPQLYRLCLADTNLTSEQLCTLVLLCEAHLPLLHCLDVSGNMRLDDTAGLAILRLTALRPMLQLVYVDDTNISHIIAHQIHTAVKHNRRISKVKLTSINSA